MKISKLQKEAYAYASQAGFWDVHHMEMQTPSQRVLSLLAKLQLISCEVAEAAEAIRKPDGGNFGEELADVMIRVADLAEATGVDLDKEITNKMEKNYKRPKMHGKLA